MSGFILSIASSEKAGSVVGAPILASCLLAPLFGACVMALLSGVVS